MVQPSEVLNFALDFQSFWAKGKKSLFICKKLLRKSLNFPQLPITSSLWRYCSDSWCYEWTSFDFVNSSQYGRFRFSRRSHLHDCIGGNFPIFQHQSYSYKAQQGKMWKLEKAQKLFIEIKFDWRTAWTFLIWKRKSNSTESNLVTKCFGEFTTQFPLSTIQLATFFQKVYYLFFF